VSGLWLCALTFASASVLEPERGVEVTPIGACASGPVGWTCWSGSVQLVAARRSAPDLPGERLSTDRFALLADWPKGAFEPAWMGDHLGWHAELTDGSRTQVVRWWALDGELFTASVVGPSADVARLGPIWLAGVDFPALSAPAR
jgi:hypothetical protein